MNTCDTCAYWTKDTKSDWGRGNCHSDSWLRGYWVRKEDFKPDSVHVEDDEGWAFTTGPKFGCVHWSAASAGDEHG